MDVSASVDQIKAEKLRDSMLKELRECPAKYDSRDLKLIEDAKDAFPCLLFLESSDWRVDPALEAMVRHCVWRKENGVLDLKATDLPREAHKMQLFHPFGKDRKGNPSFFIQTSVPPGPKEFHPTVVRHFLWSCETMRNNVTKVCKKPAIIFDCRSPQVDINVLRQVLDIFTSKYPPTAEYIAFLDMNFAFKMIVNIIKYFFPRHMWKRMIFINQDQLQELFDEDNLPPFMGGKCAGLPDEVLNSCPSLENYGRHQGLSEKAIAKLIKYFEPLQNNNN